MRVWCRLTTRCQRTPASAGREIRQTVICLDIEWTSEEPLLSIAAIFVIFEPIQRTPSHGGRDTDTDGHDDDDDPWPLERPGRLPATMIKRDPCCELVGQQQGVQFGTSETARSTFQYWSPRAPWPSINFGAESFFLSTG